VAAVQGGKEVLRAALDDLEAIIEKPKIGDDLRVQQTHRVGCDRVSKTWMKLLRHCRAANDRSAFEHLDLQTGHAEVGGARHPSGTGPEANYLIRLTRT